MQNYLTPAQAAKRLSVTTHTLRVWDKEGKIATVRTPGNQRRIPESEINRLLNPTYTKYTDIPDSSAAAEHSVDYSTHKNSRVVASTHDLLIDRELSAGGSGGNLPKWVLRSPGGQRYYAKARSRQNSLEPEAEICAYRLACLFGIPAVEYELVSLPQLSDGPVCICRDYSNGKKVMSLYRYVQGVTGQSPAEVIDGKNKFDLVTSVLSPEDIEKHVSILYLDYIVGNKDRHLRNFDVWVNADGSLNCLVPVFDSGDSLFAAEPDSEIQRANKAGNNFVHSKPYMNPHLAQANLLREKDWLPTLDSVNKADVMDIISSCFSSSGRGTGKRAEYLCRYVTGNIERLGLLR